MLYGWEGNRRSKLALYRFKRFIHLYELKALVGEMSSPPTFLIGCGTLV